MHAKWRLISFNFLLYMQRITLTRGDVSLLCTGPLHRYPAWQDPFISVWCPLSQLGPRTQLLPHPNGEPMVSPISRVFQRSWKAGFYLKSPDFKVSVSMFLEFAVFLW